MTVAGKQYVVFVAEGGSVIGSTSDVQPEPSNYTSDTEAACDARLTSFPMARIFDISDERRPKLVSKLMLETHDAANCRKILPDLAGLAMFTYGSHYCSVDNRDNATALACAYFNSGVRVFDIRDPEHPKEIAYYNPAGAPTQQSGSVYAMLRQWQPGGADWCASRLDFDFERHTLTTMCMDNGLLVMQFENGVWPMRETTLSAEQV